MIREHRGESAEKPRRTAKEILDSMRESCIRENGRLLTEEEAVSLVDEIRAELKKSEESDKCISKNEV